MYKFQRFITISTIILGTAYLADYWNFNARVYKMLNRNAQVAESMPSNYLNYNIKLNRNEEGKLQLYFGDIINKEFIKVNQNGTVGEFSDIIRKEYRNWKNKVENFLQNELKKIELSD